MRASGHARGKQLEEDAREAPTALARTLLTSFNTIVIKLSRQSDCLPSVVLVHRNDVRNGMALKMVPGETTSDGGREM